ncbi:DUF2513 domain-containing protein [Staphylococcus pseudintermedius]|uniref:DUF2513 domain-containing protein n=1 Tax=Staphylococcus pseudintermedius TaxID=283734 RepID=UPI000CFB56F9|nr:DUF2513 domain-containing protein [Staphylococcus pseudintermedius]EGQ0359864.1 DUF2513 domain-containing protein [Staphylococcus pseudintermedius]EGQ4237869.1 DUF2513 domain-containing protein [Staphylococcus pseudintermedius]EIE3619038.1 DUF2513 domain-containing protein [Staphylococcus pseudintermedius]EIS6260746.1 DUF2513 domain-containing protein [Staphylococcus pseudintermedius]EJL1408907.1 DUF2513 domain-containing protein [Staphylococcus pseudintermedius]
MKLKHECVREVLLVIEKEHNLHGILENNVFENNISEFSNEDIEYCLRLLDDAKYITADFTMDGYIVYGMTFEGHSLLDSIRNNTVWAETQNRVKKFGSISIPVLQQLASSISKKLLGLE